MFAITGEILVELGLVPLRSSNRSTSEVGAHGEKDEEGVAVLKDDCNTEPCD